MNKAGDPYRNCEEVERRTLPHQSMQYSKDYRWASNDRIGKPPAYQFLGEGETSRTLSGVLYPEITGGRLSLTTIELMAERGARGR